MFSFTLSNWRLIIVLYLDLSYFYRNLGCLDKYIKYITVFGRRNVISCKLKVDLNKLASEI